MKRSPIALVVGPDVPTVTAENAREMFGAGSVLGEGLTIALSPGGVLHERPGVTIHRVPDRNTMTKPHEENWTAHKDCVVMVEGWKTILLTHEEMLDGQERERAQLAAQAPAMARLLLKVVADADDGGEIAQAIGYKTTDEIKAILRAAGLLP